jgi:hypothetical protein
LSEKRRGKTLERKESESVRGLDAAPFCVLTPRTRVPCVLPRTFSCSCVKPALALEAAELGLLHSEKPFVRVECHRVAASVRLVIPSRGIRRVRCAPARSPFVAMFRCWRRATTCDAPKSTSRARSAPPQRAVCPSFRCAFFSRLRCPSTAFRAPFNLPPLHFFVTLSLKALFPHSLRPFAKP